MAAATVAPPPYVGADRQTETHAFGIRETEPWEALLRPDERTSASSTKTVYDGARPAAWSRSPTSSVRRYATGAGRRRASHHLYSHQADALLKAFEGPTMITTGTASGKSLCFQLPDARGR